jgi:hypothetical protein
VIDPADEGGEAPCFAHLGLDGDRCDAVEDSDEDEATAEATTSSTPQVTSPE